MIFVKKYFIFKDSYYQKVDLATNHKQFKKL